MRFISILAASAFAAFATAQSSTVSSSVSSTSSGSASSSITSAATTGSATITGSGSTQSQSMPAIATAGFDINNVTTADKRSWCDAQYNSCPEICGGDGTQLNQCEDSDLSYQCVCYNGTVPDCSRYTQTVPFFICQETFAQCERAHPDDLQGKRMCKQNAQCGTIELQNTTADASSSSNGGNGPTSSGSSPSSTSSPAGGNAAMALSPNMATGILAAVLMAAFRLL